MPSERRRAGPSFLGSPAPWPAPPLRFRQGRDSTSGGLPPPVPPLLCDLPNPPQLPLFLFLPTVLVRPAGRSTDCVPLLSADATRSTFHEVPPGGSLPAQSPCLVPPTRRSLPAAAAA